MKKQILILIALFSLSPVLFAGGGSVQERRDSTVVEKGLSLASFMREKALDEAFLAVSTEDEIRGEEGTRVKTSSF